ncbi:DEAD/DEAH box helicase [Coraliomargarita parva]|uniref:DEAD/DEAH box helicase n=1 Tax=Coraliomargarita parva TaxID=3014050 RepID=UPI0022B4DCC6|nr:DEAD/DEAH box helicase [Coraliomargarita parva]
MPESAFSLLSDGVQRAIFRQGWTQLHSIQVRSINVLRRTDSDLIIAAPTAGGKTEAAFLPILSDLSEAPEKLVIYVSPLKALINDQWARLETLCADLDIPVRRWHGDVTATEKKAFRKEPGGILLITPESLESNFINYGRDLSRIYKHTAFVVIDELHVFVDDVRGMHLRSLISRLCAVAECNPRMVGLSATLGDATLARDFMRPDDSERVVLISEGGGRDIRIGLRAQTERPRWSERRGEGRLFDPDTTASIICAVPYESWQSLAPLAKLGKSLSQPPGDSPQLSRDALDCIADDLSAHFQVGTNLVFGNSRRTLEELADILHEQARKHKWRHDPFCLHHGSLAKCVREDVEMRLKGPVPATALCTSTLELGIDIGSVRTVGQIDPPWSVSALIQRLGRSGRRNGEPARMRLYTRDETPHTDSSLANLMFPELLRSIAVVQLMLSKWIEAPTSCRLHVSTMVHQVMSILRQTGGIHAAHLYQILCVDGPFRAIDQPLFRDILHGLGENDIIEQIPTGELILALVGEEIASSHDFYAAFISNEIFTVRWQDEIIGEIPADNVLPAGQCFILGGRRWVVEDIGEREKTVWVKPTNKRVPPLFVGEAGDIDGKVFSKMRELLLSEEYPSFLDHNARVLLGAARYVGQNSGAATTGLVVGATFISWFPWVGSKTFRTLRLMLSYMKIKHEFDSLSLTFMNIDLAEFRRILAALKAFRFDPVELASAMPVKTFDKYDALLPEELLDQVNAVDRVDVADAMEVVNNWLRI